MRARNEYILSLEATNAFIKKYFDQDVYDILEVRCHFATKINVYTLYRLRKIPAAKGVDPLWTHGYRTSIAWYHIRIIDLFWAGITHSTLCRL